ncbi:hypothetical protein [Bacillus phage vB_BanS-Thrax1]|nr:hypothetical protein [Bacillus phage vB_BanS-Thrax1]
MGRTTLKIRLANGKKVKEVVTDELLEHFGKAYVGYTAFAEEVEANVLTFEEYVVNQLTLRDLKIRKALEQNGKKEEK